MPQAVSLNVKHVRQTFGAALALEDVSLAIAGGDFVSLVGPSGCGKSTLLRLLAGLIDPSQGTVERVPLQPRIGFVFQEANLLPWRTTLENIALPLEVAGLDASQRQTRAQQALAMIGLTSADGGKFPRELSGGMRMRVSLARALVTDPEVLLLDEPFAALDDLLRQQLNEELLRLWEQQRWTAVFVTHNVAEAVFLSQRIVVMSPRPGRIVAEIPVPFTAREPGLRSRPQFAALCGEVAERLRH